MQRSKFSDEQILTIVKKGEAGRKVPSELQRLKQVGDENRRLKHIVAEQTLDIQARPPQRCRSPLTSRRNREKLVKSCGEGPT